MTKPDLTIIKMPAEVRLEDCGCPLGCASGDELVLRSRDRITHLPGEYSVVRCRTCGLMRTNPRPTSDTMDFYYPDDYGPYKGTQVGCSNRLLKPSFSFRTWLRTMIPQINDQSRVIPPLPPGCMLEVGCASGSFLHQMTALDWQVEGIEFSASAAASAQRLGYTVHVGAAESIDLASGPFDLVTAWMVLEHLHEPVEVLNRLRNWTKPGGMFAFSVPDCSSLGFRIFKRYWYALHLPAHLYHYTPRTLEHVLREGGWRIDRIIWQRNVLNLLPSLGHVMREKCRALRLAEYLEATGRLEPILRLLALFMAKIRQSGRITVWATRID